MADNPFEEKREPNPFEDPSVQATTGGAGGGTFDNPFDAESSGGAFVPPAPVQPPPAVVQSAYHDSAPAPTNTYGAYDTGAYDGGGGGSNAYAAPAGGLAASVSSGGVREKELEERAKALDRREAELNRREQELGAGRPKNWPSKYFRIAYHDIDEEIPEPSRRAVHFAHYSFWGLAVCLTYNFFFAASGIMFTRGKFDAWLMAAIYLVLGVPGAYYLWYRRLYNAAKRDSALLFGWFFLMYLGHIVFCFYAMIAPSNAFGSPTYSLTGIMSMIAAFEEKDAHADALGGIYVFGFILFTVELVLSVYTMRIVYMAFRGSGHTLQEARSAAAREGVSAAARV